MNETKTQRLNELFAEWRQRMGEEAERMCLDGIVCEDNYEKANPKLLFVAKEPNHPEGSGSDYREWWSQEVKYPFSNRLCQWAYGVRNGFPPLSKFDAQADKLEVMSHISFMNLKKVGGTGEVDLKEIRSVTNRDKDLLRRQIEIIKPDVIIGGVGVGDSSLWPLLFPEIAFQPRGFDIRVARVKCARVIEFYHPSYRVSRAMSYSLLGRVFQSDEFRRL